MCLQTKAIQEELAVDMKILEQMLQETSNEAMLHLQKKVKNTVDVLYGLSHAQPSYIQNTLKEEIKLYRSYLAEAEKEERQRELELDTLLTAEVEQQWAKRVAQWRTEKEARRKLMDDVMRIRKQQIQEKSK